MNRSLQSESIMPRILILIVFGIAFGFIEAAVVVYLRALFYPDGFAFPIAPFSTMPGANLIGITEISREAATLVLLVSGSWLMARDLRGRLAVFLISFAVWDIFYYVWLKVILNWPQSLWDWDILFLIPSIWAGPVLAPVITSLLMVAVAGILLSSIPWRMSFLHQLFLLAAIIAIVVCFCVPGKHILDPDYARWFSWPAFLLTHGAVVIVLIWSLYTSRHCPSSTPVSQPRMCPLADSSCVPCQGGVEPLRGEVLQEWIAQIDSGWKVIEDHRLERAYQFPDFQSAMNFALQVGRIAEQQNHHPDLVIGWGQVMVKLWTHKINGLHANDFILAAKIDALGFPTQTAEPDRSLTAAK